MAACTNQACRTNALQMSSGWAVRTRKCQQKANYEALVTCFERLVVFHRHLEALLEFADSETDTDRPGG